MPEIDLIPDAVDGNLGLIRATMLFPSDEFERYQIIEASKMRDSGKPPESLPEKRDLRMTDPYFGHLEEEMKKREKRALVAGFVLLVPYLMHSTNEPAPSLGRGLSAAIEFGKSERFYPDNTKMSVSENAVKRHWRDFRSVAHFWAAYRANEYYPFAPWDEFYSVEYIPRFLEVAAGIWQFATSFIPDRSTSPILDPEGTWFLPDWVEPRVLSQENVAGLGLPDQIAELLKDYKSRNSIRSGGR